MINPELVLMLIEENKALKAELEELKHSKQVQVDQDAQNKNYEHINTHDDICRD